MTARDPAPTLNFPQNAYKVAAAALSREWLLTNGRGSYAMGTLAGANTRRYHGLLIAAEQPPVGRVLRVAQVACWATVDGNTFPLNCSAWQAEHGVERDITALQGLDTFTLVAGLPVWEYGLGANRLRRAIWLARQADTVFVRFTHLGGSEPLALRLQPWLSQRDHHGSLAANSLPFMLQSLAEGGWQVLADQAPPLRWWTNLGQWHIAPHWTEPLHLAVEAERGFDPVEHYFVPGDLFATLMPGQSLTLTFSLDETPIDPDEALQAVHRHAQQCLVQAALPAATPDWFAQLVLAADQFVVTREPAGLTVIAGYPWFGDWGRDTMIALPGLLLTTGRTAEAAQVLRTFARHVWQGLLPNRFPDSGEAPEYNTVDASLWFFYAIEQTLAAGADPQLADDLYPTLVDMIEWHVNGTAHGIGRTADGLLAAGEPGVQLTWMDVKIGDEVITPRMGKPVEINALWLFALRFMVTLATKLGQTHDSNRFARLQAEAEASFVPRFWQGQHLYDVVDGPTGDDATLRPNQLIAVALLPDLFTPKQRQQIVLHCREQLLTPIGLRTLAPNHPNYVGQYLGSPAGRDRVYHQGTVWPWLLGSYCRAWVAAFNTLEHPLAVLETLADHLTQAGLGTVSEIADADAPHQPRGCPAQAWSVAAALDLWHWLNDKDDILR